MLLEQTPSIGARRLFFRGDTVEFFLSSDAPLKGRAFLRTNIGNASIRRAEIIGKVECRLPMAFQDWHDIPMLKLDEYTFSIKLALLEVGHFKAKCCFFPDSGHEPLWPGAEIAHINVEPSEYCCANSIYCAFVRQFGANKDKPRSTPLTDVGEPAIKKLDNAKYTVIPPSGTFRGLISSLDFIINELNCRIVHLLPINPTPTVYGRMGRHGSPYASLDFTGVDPALADFDKKATPLEQFMELVGAIHGRDAKLFIDIAINHTGWGAKLHEEHPEWFVRREDGTIASPGAWGVTWEDLTELDYSHNELWSYLADVFLVWCGRGVDGFRCDAGYMIPYAAWQFIVAKVRTQYPNAIFLLEGLGGDPAVTSKLLDEANMNWAYSELFQNYTRKDIEKYVAHAHMVSKSDGILVHYAETHDNNRLAAKSDTYAKMRTALCALASSTGAFGFTNGVEWFAKEKIQVHEANALNWNAKINQVDRIARLNTILIAHPAFYNGSNISFLDFGHPSVVAFSRSDASSKKHLLVLVNLECEKAAGVSWDPASLPFRSGAGLRDLISGAPHTPKHSDGKHTLTLEPGQALCLSPDESDIEMIEQAESDDVLLPDHIDLQRAKAMALDIIQWRNKTLIVSGLELKGVAKKLLRSPFSFCESLCAPDEHVPVSRWNWPEDQKRKALLPPDHLLVITAPRRFRAAIADASGSIISLHDSLRAVSGEFFAVFTRLPQFSENTELTIRMAVYDRQKCERSQTKIMSLAKESAHVSTEVQRRDLEDFDGAYLDSNGRGGMLHTRLRWGELHSKYDCLLAANLNKDYPEDRRIMWRRCRAWLVHHARSEELTAVTTDRFILNSEGGGTWCFHVPVGSGLFVDLFVAVSMVAGRNAIRVNAQRKSISKRAYLNDDVTVHLILRPDIEDRNFHELTKAYAGPEKSWPPSIAGLDHGFTFSPTHERALRVTASKGSFHIAPEWQYCVHNQLEAERGMDSLGDLFSPGYFEIALAGGEQVELVGQVLTPDEPEPLSVHRSTDMASLVAPIEGSVEKVLAMAMSKYIATRNSLKTVIAGYPWFLDWGRDTLICARGLISAGLCDDTMKVLAQFARFAENGTLPNMIRGGDASNRDTSDAPLWLLTACSDFAKATGDTGFLRQKVSKDRTLLEALKSIVEGYMAGTPNGIGVDHASMLVYSPPHFTWMDTNFPAGTPRGGYPIEIQALWHSALRFLSSVEEDRKWPAMADKVKESIKKHFLREDGWLADCLHCSKGTSASQAERDDHLRPNQLLAVTLGAITDCGACRSILESTASLLVPGAIRTLADRPVSHRLPIHANNGGPLLNDPSRPYWGHYEGDEDTRRKPAYHNGTAWTWLFPSYAEAHYMTFGEPGKATAQAILSSSTTLLKRGCFGQIPEIVDGDYPHAQRGCDAQAWGVTELYRVWKLLS